MDSPYEKLIRMMQDEGAQNNTAEIQIGIMTGTSSLKIGELQLDSSDLLFDERLLKPICTKVSIEIKSAGEGEHTHEWTDKSTYLAPLKAGDRVAVQRMSDSLYIVIGKLVNAS